MLNDKEDLKNQLQSIKDNLEKKLSGIEVDNESNMDNLKESKEKKSKKNPVTKKNPIPLKVDMEVVSEDKKEKKNKENELKSNLAANIETPKKVIQKKGKTKKKKIPVIPIVLLVVLLGILFYIYNLKKNLQEDKSAFEKEQQEAIDYSNDVYFKEVEDEEDDEELQDFAVYKDVPEVVAENNSKTQKLSASDEKSINQQISNKAVQDQKVIDNKKEIKEGDEVAFIDESTKIVAPNESPKETVKEEVLSEEVFSDMIKVIGLQHKDGSFTMPKKVKKTNAFKVRVRLKKNQISKSDQDTNIMLVIKNSSGNTIKIDSKKVNFGKQNSKVLYLEFYEIFPDRLKTNTNYSFSVFANKKLIKSYRKSI